MIATVNLPKAFSAVPVLPAPLRNTAFSGPPVPYSSGNTPVPTFPASCPGVAYVKKKNLTTGVVRFGVRVTYLPG